VTGPVSAIELQVGQSADLPDGMGSVRFDGLLRFASLDVAHNPGGIWVLLFAALSLVSLTMSLMVPRRRVWVRLISSDRIEFAALSRRDDPNLPQMLEEIVREIRSGSKK